MPEYRMLEPGFGADFLDHCLLVVCTALSKVRGA